MQQEGMIPNCFAFVHYTTISSPLKIVERVFNGMATNDGIS
jgi:hypothetical protein